MSPATSDAAPTLFLSADALDARRAVANGPLKPLADSLAADLEPILSRELHIPPEKALLSRIGGRCESCGTALDFDPFSPDRHRCPACGRIHDGDLHHRWWVYPYHLWLAERAVHAAVLFALRGEARHARLAAEILRRYAAGYADYPNVDNVLGPTRLFFSTYLESIWLLQVCVAVDLLRATQGSAGGVPRDVLDAAVAQVIAPSSAIIARYDEGASNRQVWNNAALMAAALITGDRSEAERIVKGKSGLESHLDYALLSDGTWYEGDNYHLFAHRGLWFGVTMAERAGIPVDAALVRRFEEGFATPFATALPDFTFPSRKDSQYAVTLQQWRFAESCELGLARHDDDRLVAALARLYSPGVPEGDTGRSRSTAEVEKNLPPARLTRAALGWRSLLLARPELPPLGDAEIAPRSASLDGQGITVFRRDRGHVYVALDWGQSGGGHGHPDRLNVLFAHGDARWLDDLGTGSYVDPSLHWYRSTLAHNAPLVNGQSQWRADGRLLAHDERGGVGWALAEVDGIAPGVTARRAIVVTPDYFVDELRWTSDAPVRFELPIHFDGALHSVRLGPASLDGGDGLEDGFGFARDSSGATVAPMTAVELHAARDGHEARAFVCASGEARWFRATGPGQPPTTARAFHLVRCEGASGAIRSVWAWSSRVTDVAFEGERIRVTLGEETHEHWQADEWWQMELTHGAAHSGIELFGWREDARPSTADASVTQGRTVRRIAPIAVLRSPSTGEWPSDAADAALTQSSTFELGSLHYRRSEETWAGAGRPSARVKVGATPEDLVLDIIVRTATPLFVPPGTENPYDNEPADINGHGVQVYVRTETDGGAWLVVPDAGGGARVAPIKGWGALPAPRAEWRPAPDGFEVRVRMPVAGGPKTGNVPIALDIIVNDAAPGRERRRGQLVLSGAEGEFVYLRGDRHDPGRLLPFVLVD